MTKTTDPLSLLRRATYSTVAFLLLLALQTANAADFDAGWKAYQSGDFATALREWQPLAEQDNPRAQFNLGVLYDEGKGAARDHATARLWWEKAAAQGDARAQHNLAQLYIAGDGVELNFPRAITWLAKSAAQGYERSQYTLGKMYLHGLGVAAEPAVAVKWLQEAGDKGLTAAQYNLGKLYRDGAPGVPGNLKKAVHWFRTAAMQGHAQAQERLATRHLRGEGVPKNRILAMSWYSLAASRGMTSAAQSVATLRAQLSQAQVDAALARAAELEKQIKN